VAGFDSTPGDALPGMLVYGMGGGGDGYGAIPAVVALSASVVGPIPAVIALGGVAGAAIPAVIALAKPLPVAARAPHRTTQMPDILAAFPPSLYSHDPGRLGTLAVTVGSGWRVDGDLLEVTGGAVPFVCDLREFTLGELAAALTTAGYTATVRAGWAAIAATTLVDGAGRFADDPHLHSFTTTLFRLLRSIVLVWDRLADDLDLGVAQMDLRQAEGEWLDFWGVLYGVGRPPLEEDTRYRTRIDYLSLRPRSNNVAIEAAIGAILGLDATVTDGDPLGAMRCVYDADDPDPVLDVLWDAQAIPPLIWDGYPPHFIVTLPSGTDEYTVAQVAQLVDVLKAAGPTYEVVFA
jgi:hypothetical protein